MFVGQRVANIEDSFVVENGRRHRLPSAAAVHSRRFRSNRRYSYFAFWSNFLDNIDSPTDAVVVEKSASTKRSQDFVVAVGSPHAAFPPFHETDSDPMVPMDFQALASYS